MAGREEGTPCLLTPGVSLDKKISTALQAAGKSASELDLAEIEQYMTVIDENVRWVRARLKI